MVVIFDLDGTLSDHRHRLSLAPPLCEKPDWSAYSKACVDDPPILPMIAMAKTLGRDHKIWIVSGRGSEVQEETIAWIKKHEVPVDMLILRKEGYHAPGDVLKAGWVSQGLVPRKEDVLAVFEDQPSVVSMWRNLGYPCYSVCANQIEGFCDDGFLK